MRKVAARECFTSCRAAPGTFGWQGLVGGTVTPLQFRSFALLLLRRFLPKLGGAPQVPPFFLLGKATTRPFLRARSRSALPVRSRFSVMISL